MRIAMIGQRGVPASYGGVERHVEELGARLVERGHEVTVFSRIGYDPEGRTRISRHRGMDVVPLRALASKHLEALSHSGLASVAAVSSHYDVVHYHALGPGIFSPVARWFSRAAVVQTIHGRDDQRAKWSLPARTLLRSAVQGSFVFPDGVITVSSALGREYGRRARGEVRYIPNGVLPPEPGPHPLDPDLGLEAGRYLLFVGRLVPEKCPDLLVRAFRRVADPDLKLVIVGGSSNTDGYVDELHRAAAGDRRIVFTGYRYGAELAALFANCAAFVIPSRLEGLPLTLLEAAAHGAPVVASDIAPHLEVLSRPRSGVRLFGCDDVDDLTEALREAAAGAGPGSNAVLRDEVRLRYDWDRVADATEAFYLDLLGRAPEIDLRADERIAVASA